MQWCQRLEADYGMDDDSGIKQAEGICKSRDKSRSEEWLSS